MYNRQKAIIQVKRTCVDIYSSRIRELENFTKFGINEIFHASCMDIRSDGIPKQSFENSCRFKNKMHSAQ